MRGPLFIIYFFTIFNAAHAQGIYFKQYTPNDGLPASKIYQMVKDEQGFIWLCTANCVSKFNGFDFRKYNLSNGFPSHGAIAGLKDNKGRLWFTTFNDKACYYDGYSFHNFNTPQDISWILTDRNGDLTFLTTGGHILFYKNDTLFRDVTIHDQKLTTGCYTDDGKLLVHSSCGSSYFVLEHEKVTNTVIVDSSGSYLRFHRLQNGKMLASNSRGLYKIDANGLHFIYHFDSRSLMQTEIFDIYDDGHEIWIGAINGLFRCRNDLDFRTLQQVSKKSFVVSVIQDRDSNYWFATRNEGIYSFRGVRAYSLFLSGERDNNIRQVSGYDDKHVYVFYENGEIDKIEVDHDSIRLIYLIRLNSSIVSLCRDYTDGFYVRTQQGVFHFREGAVPYKGDTIYYHSTDGRLYVYKLNCGLFISRPNQKALEQVFPTLTSNKLTEIYQKYDRVYLRSCAVYHDSAWIGSEKGIFLETLNGFTKPFNDTITNAYVADIKIDHNGRVWVATKGHGIFFIENNKMRIIPAQTGMGALNCNSLYLDAEDNAWVASDEGLYKIMKGSLQVTNYNYRNLLQSFEVTDVYKSGNMVFATTPSGLNIFDDTRVSFAASEPFIHITGLAINNHDTIPANDLVLRYDQNAIRFDFTATDYSSNYKPSFYYCLRGKDSTWRHTYQSSLEFSYLSPGDYTFYITTGYPNNKSNTAPVAIHFVIKPPFWQTWWFYSLVGAFVLSLVLFIIRHYKKLGLKEKVHLQTELKALRAQMNPHFIFNSLNAIQEYIIDSNPKEANQYLNKLAVLMRIIIDFSLKNHISIDEELRFLTLYTELENQRYNGNIRFDFMVDDNIDTHTTSIPPMLVQPLIENAIKHGVASKRNGIILVRFKRSGNDIVCEVSDNGKGRQLSDTDSKKHKSVSLDNIRKQLETQLKNKSISPLTITDLYNEALQITGTRVAILLPKSQNT